MSNYLGTLVVGLVLLGIGYLINRRLQRELIKEQKEIREKERQEKLLHTLIQIKEFINYSMARVGSIATSPPFEKTIVMRARIELTDWLLLYPTVLSNSSNHQFQNEISKLSREFKVYNEALEEGAYKISIDTGWISVLQSKAQEIMPKLTAFLKLLDEEIEKIQSELNPKS